MNNKYVSPGVFVKEMNISIVKPNFSKKYLRRIKHQLKKDQIRQHR